MRGPNLCSSWLGSDWISDRTAREEERGAVKWNPSPSPLLLLLLFICLVYVCVCVAALLLLCNVLLT